MYTSLHVTYVVFLSDFNETCMLLTDFWKMIRYQIWNDMIYLLTAIGLSPGGRSTVHIYTQTIHNNENQSSGSRVVTCGRTDTKLTVTLRTHLQTLLCASKGADNPWKVGKVGKFCKEEPSLRQAYSELCEWQWTVIHLFIYSVLCLHNQSIASSKASSSQSAI